MSSPSPSASARYVLYADLVALTHAVLVAFVVWSELLILLGWLLEWQWTLNLIFRLSHIGLVGWVFVQDLLGIICPLTTWERDLRALGGQTNSGKSFIGRVVHAVLMCELDERTLRHIRMSFAVVVFATFALILPQWS